MSSREPSANQQHFLSFKTNFFSSELQRPFSWPRFLLIGSCGIASTAFLFWKYFLKSLSTNKKETPSSNDQLVQLPHDHHSFTTNEELIQHLKNSINLSPILENIFRTTDRGKYAIDFELEKKDFELVRPYADAAMPLRCNATISAPHIHVTCLNAVLDVFENVRKDRSSSYRSISCLDIGSGSGFVSTALCHLSEYFDLTEGSKILAIDHMQELVNLGQENVEKDERSRKFLTNSSGIHLVFKKGDGYDSENIRQLFHEAFSSNEHHPTLDPSMSHSLSILLHSSETPLFDVIHVGAASPTLPKHLYSLLKPNGRLICPVGPSNGTQELLCVVKSVKALKKHSRMENSEFSGTPNDTMNVVQQESIPMETQMLVQSMTKVHFVPLFSSEKEQERHLNRSNPKVVSNPQTGEKFIVLPYVHFCAHDESNTITSLKDIQWEGDAE
ncbi:hypothetical protein FDP41_003995 [Naegleria fowleri]|uniref:protein-L-isoaspartate(D-aspartate) O-methyltransferase n=1 Tax=Naegleria fowleri TaxID=5763 RepID=A0A6A5BSB5_NAEFO|nr:uncharacterized protein FDP41_003995 [Naegleria fowleri]KAF0976700.1 hypothetical protein FDP41_003995 [Naegleria fowleri]